jgi:septal ring factor EnvC (AmiA/AmiB activator)
MPIDQKQKDLAQQESDLRDKVQKLESMIANAPRVAEETSRRQREELLMRANEGGSRLDVSLSLQDKRYGDERRGTRRRGSLRKERREGRIVFLVLVIALVITVIWLLSHLHF